MKLFENESKELFKKYGLPVPDGVVASGVGEVTAPCVVKALVLAGKRGKAKAVKVCKTVEEAKEFAAQLLGKNVLGESVSRLYLEQPIEFSKELFASITYDSIKKTPVILFSDLGGVDIEELARTRPEKLLKINVDVALGVEEFQLREELKKFGVESALIPKIASILAKLYVVFSQTDARICEANPIAVTADGKLICTGAAFVLDDDALSRHSFKFPPRTSVGKPLTKLELDAKKIDEGDYRGIAGKYLELEGDIALMTSGGGGSLTNMDALLAVGGKPANFTEYGGNPPTEKMYKLTKVILSKPGLNGCWIVGGIANNTRVDVTFEGIAQALREIKPKYPIVIRRAGPGEKEGLEIMRKLARDENLDITVYGAEMPMTATAKIIVEKTREYALKNKK